MIHDTRTILIVDDCPEDRELYRRYLLRDREYSYTFLEATLGQQGLQLWQQHQPDIILLDYRLPDLDGLEFLAKLQPSSQQPCLPVIVVTGQGNEAIAVQAIKAGAQDYLLKGQITAESLHLAVNGAIEAVQLRTQLQQRIERERVVAQITRLIHQSLDLDEILQTTVTQVRQFLQSDRVLIFRLQSDGSGIVTTESVGCQWTPLLSTSLYDPCLNENYVESFRQGLVTVKPDIHNGSIDPCHVELLAKLQVRANLVVPILQDNRLWGMLIAHHCAAPRQWQPLEIDLLKELATQAGIAIQQAELYQLVKSELAQRQQTQSALESANAQLEERAAALATSNENLQAAMEELAVAEEELRTQNEELAIAQTKVEQQRQRYQALFEFAPDGYLVTDEQGVIQEANSTAAALLQISLDRLIGKPLNVFIPPEDRQAFRNQLYQWLTKDRLTITRQTWELNLQPRTGQAFPVEVSLAQEVEATPSLRWLIRDITQRKQAEIALRESEERLSLAIDGAGMAAWDCDVQTGRAIWSEKHFTLQGYEPVPGGEARFEMWRDRVHSDDLAEVMQAVEQAEQTRSLYCPEYRIIRADDGQIRWVKDFGRFLYNETGLAVRFIGVSFDITDRKQAEVALRESEQRLQMALDGSGGGFWDWNIVTNEDYLSPRWLEMLGYEAGELPDNYCTWEQLIHPDDRGWVMERLHAHLQDDSVPYKFEYRVLTKSGEWKWIANYGKVVMRDAQGNPLRMAGIHYDITDRKQAEVALRENEQLLRLALSSAHAGSWDWEIPTGKIVWSPENYDLYGLDLANGSLQYQDWDNALHPDDRERANASVRRVVEQHLGEFHCEFRIIHAQRGVRWLLALGQVTVDERGEPVRMSGINLDITDRKIAEEALRQSEEFKQRLLESSTDCIKVIDLDGRLVYMNAGGMCLMEIDDVASYFKIEWLCFWQDEYRENAEAALRRAKAGQVAVFQGYCPTAKGTPKWWEVTVSPILDGAGQVERVLSISRDISDRKLAEAERERLLQQEQEARAEAERANRIKDEFLAILSHELRSPLNPILGWTKLLQTRKFDAAKTDVALATIERNAKLQTQLIDDLLDVARIIRGKLILNASPVNLAFAIESAIETVRTAAVAKSILIHPVLPNIGQVSGDCVRLQQIVWNLLSNAIKFTPNGGRVEIHLERIDKQAQITVKDTGKGISPDFLPHIFEYFRQEDASITRKHGGLGLGLAIVHYLVEAHGGTISAASRGEGQGATFTVRLPLLSVEPQSDRSDSQGGELDLTSIRVLLVDDEPDTRELLAFTLKEYGAEAMAVASAAEVLALLESFKPDILVSDIGMPSMDGYTLLRQVRSLPPERGGQIPAIALTAYARVEDRQQALVAGFQGHISKPVDPIELVAAISDLLSHR